LAKETVLNTNGESGGTLVNGKSPQGQKFQKTQRQQQDQKGTERKSRSLVHEAKEKPK